MNELNEQPAGLYNPSFEKDSCGVGFVANMKGRKSHQIVSHALTMLERMAHRGACGCEPNTGDGAGILIQVPHEFFAGECTKLGIKLPAYGQYGVGLVFFPRDPKVREECRTILNRKIKKMKMALLGYRIVPVTPADLGEAALASEPIMEQVFIKRIDGGDDPEEFERKLFILRKYATHLITDSVKGVDGQFYFSSLSYKTIAYKGMLTSGQLRYYFADLENEEVVSALAVIHSRFSTNTFPSWRLAQPFRFIAHNGEINTVQGNINWLKSKEAFFASPYFTQEEINMILPICNPKQSDSSNLDNVVELLVHAGRSLPHVMMMLIPEAWNGNDNMSSEKKDFYEYHANLMEPWDGPASITFTDGKIVGATLDRNGLRPSRYVVTNDDMVIMASEVGVLDVDQSKVIMKGRLQPGKMFVVDLEQGRIISDEELKKNICTRQPYGQWLRENKVKLSNLPEPGGSFHKYDPVTFLKRQISFGYTSEDLRIILSQMCESGKEALGSMGSDIPLAVLSKQAQHLSSYFKQLFAQVTNPPIDSIRERLVMSLNTHVGGSLNLLEESPEHCITLELPTPVLSNNDLEKIRYIDHGHLQTKTIYTYFKADGLPGSLEKGLTRVCQYVTDAIEDGFTIIILSDRSFDSGHAQIPSLLALAAVHHDLIRKGLRGKVGLLVEAGDVWETHHYATLLGYGASGVNPYLVYQTIHDMKKRNILRENLTEEKAIYNYKKAVDGELLKIMSKMGISTLQSYHGAQIFEALGISKEVVDIYFTGTVSRIGGLTLDDIAREAIAKHLLAFPKTANHSPRLEVGGVYQWKQRGEAHLFNPQTIHLLQHSTKMNDYALFKKYSSLINEQSEKAITLRSLLKFKKSKSIPLSDVEPKENIFKRFATGAMSFGSISYEAHSTLAVAMNRIGGKSNCGEGGEDEIRFARKENGDWENSAIKQVASGRFGVTSYYLTNAKELQIKMAQGAKPGEGGQLPGHKVDDWIGRVRHATPGVGLISPPPHHDIYSIEDLAQLIFDLKNANREARISVKLVSEAGVGTIASGVAKAHADVILISGHDGGTGASPISSIRHAGLPWELGLAEAHQTLVKNKLRGRVVLQTDGQIRTGRDLAMAALLGAEEWGVATAALVTTGCIMMRKCHLNTCPVGVATQNKELRALFTGKPEYVVNMFTFLAEELREIMAELGFRTVDEMVGQADYLQPREEATPWKLKNVNLSALLHKEKMNLEVALFKQEEQDHGLDNVLDRKLIQLAHPALKNTDAVKGEFTISNQDRSVGAMLSNEISKIYLGAGLPKDTIHIKFNGTAGQSFGAFTTSGVTFELQGDANDYFGKGLSGGKLILYPDKKITFDPSKNIIVGNVAFFGATSGEAYIHGMAGERFAVRNSGATVIVEGVGDHGCEYMTGGMVVVLGETGRNFAAGMSGGVAYVWDVNKTFVKNCNLEMVELEPLEVEDEEMLHQLIEKHQQLTGSKLATPLLSHWKQTSRQFIKVMPTDYKAVMAKKKQELMAG
ncbi:MAG: Glutamate synthase [NADPH] large chain [Cytophagales bacterium]|jgi:glutamate synthase (NADPH/NADH) large chain|nr:glutamate synthase large subunit [Bacteroidota bacterium]MBS1981885.1 glutamate synthase large subunit [Bacteroidota bacterium]WHZ07508.1 MAG: Glutamate synthase [NADPH] large chain [Cytophagales bacterium]